MKKLLTTSLLSLSLYAFTQSNYTLDKNHSRLGFTVSHFGISHVDGIFKSFEATMKSGKEDFSDAEISMKADANSINTEVEARDKDLRSPNWLDAEKYPNIEFKSKSFKKTGDKNYKLEGNITIHGITKPISFGVIYNGKVLNPSSKKNSVGFSLSGKLNRKDFNVGSEAFEKTVGQEVELRANVEFIME